MHRTRPLPHSPQTVRHSSLLTTPSHSSSLTLPHTHSFTQDLEQKGELEDGDPLNNFFKKIFSQVRNSGDAGRRCGAWHAAMCMYIYPMCAWEPDVEGLQ